MDQLRINKDVHADHRSAMKQTPLGYIAIIKHHLVGVLQERNKKVVFVLPVNQGNPLICRSVSVKSVSLGDLLLMQKHVQCVKVGNIMITLLEMRTTVFAKIARQDFLSLTIKLTILE